MKEENRVWFESEKMAQQRIEQARSLKKKARTGGLKFEAYLPPGLAEWILDMVENGHFVDPSEAVFVFMQQAQELEPHSDLKEQLLARRLEKGAEGPFLTLDEVKKELAERKEKRSSPAIWQKINRIQT